MNTNKSIIQFALTHLEGKDSDTLLQGLITGDVHSITENHPLFTGCCDIKGRLIATFWATRWNNGFILISEISAQELLIQHLKKYALFSKATIQSSEDFSMLTSLHLPTDWSNPLSLERVYITAQTTLLFTPQMINLQKNDGVSFKKGCYLGQEIVARTEYLGKLKRHLHKGIVGGKASVGNAVFSDEQDKVGHVVAAQPSSTTTYVLAVLQDRALNRVLSCQGHALSLLKKP